MDNQEPVKAEKPKPWVVCAAMRHRTTGRIVTGARHYDPIMRAQMDAAEGAPFWRGCEQGFIDQWGNFLTRKTALRIATENNQIRRRCGGDTKELFSECLY